MRVGTLREMELELDLADARRLIHELQARAGMYSPETVGVEPLLEMIAPLPPRIQMPMQANITAEFDDVSGWRITAWGYGNEGDDRLQLGYYMQRAPNRADIPYLLAQMHERFMRQLLHWIRKNKK